MSDPLEQVILPLRQEGRLDSEGQFSLDGRRALEKMACYAFPDPHRYLLNLVSWAVASGAGRLDFHSAPGRLELHHDGSPPSLTEVRDLFSHFPSLPLALQELAIGLAGHSRLSGSQATLATPKGSLRVRKGESCPEEGGLSARTTLTLEESIPLAGRLQRALGGRAPQAAVVENHCGQAGIPLSWNGEMLNHPLLLPHLCRAIHLVGPTPLPLPEDLEDTVEKRPSPGPFSLLVARSQVPLLETPAVFLVRGVRFDTEPLSPGGIPLMAYVQAPHLCKDLSQSRLVANQEYQDLRALLLALAEELE